MYTSRLAMYSRQPEQLLTVYNNHWNRRTAFRTTVYRDNKGVPVVCNDRPRHAVSRIDRRRSSRPISICHNILWCNTEIKARLFLCLGPVQSRQSWTLGSSPGMNEVDTVVGSLSAVNEYEGQKPLDWSALM